MSGLNRSLLVSADHQFALLFESSRVFVEVQNRRGFLHKLWVCRFLPGVIQFLASDRRQQCRQVLPVESIRRQNRMRRRPGCRRRRVLQEGGQSAGRAEVDVTASALSLQLLYGFTKSNLAPRDIPEIIA